MGQRPCVNHVVHEKTVDEAIRLWKTGLGLLGWYPGEKVFVVIEYFGGFEYFNTAPYHNYETWGHGWRVKILAHGRDDTIADLETPIVVSDECLECAVNLALSKLPPRLAAKTEA